MILVCTLNIIAYAMHDFSGRLNEIKEDKNLNEQANHIEIGCEIAFIIEIFCEMIARGFINGRRAFFKNPWLVCNLFSIVCSGISILPGIPDKLELICKIFSMLRPLRILQMITPLKIQFERLLRSIPKINTSIWRLIIFMSFYTILGLHIFMGSLEHRCRVTENPPAQENEPWQIYEKIPYLCGQWKCPEEIYIYIYQKSSYCRSPYDYDREYFSKEADIHNLNYGYTNFDNFGSAFFTVYHIMRIVGWGEINFMYWRQMSTFLVSFYFLSLILICSYVLSNIILAELYESFEEQRSIRSYAEYRLKRKREKENKTKVNIKDIELEYQKQINNEGLPEQYILGHKQLSNCEEQIIEEDMEDENAKSDQSPKILKNNTPQNKYDYVKSPTLGQTGSEQRIQNDNNQSGSRGNLSNQTASISENQKGISKQIINVNAVQIEMQEQPSSFRQCQQQDADKIKSNQDVQNKENAKININPSQTYIPKSGPNLQQANADTNISEDKIKHSRQIPLKKIDIASEVLSVFFRLAILLDICVICADRHEIDHYEKTVYIEIDYFILYIFIVEIMVKIAQQRLDYFKDLLNNIDLVILVVRFISSNYPLFSGKDLSDEDAEWVHCIKAIHVFRIFQVVKLTSFFRTINNLISYFFNTLTELLYYILIIVFYSALFGLIGHELFAFKAEFINEDQIPKDLTKGKPPRINYDTFFSSFEAVFLAVLNEQWNKSMYNYMRIMGDYVSAFWIIIISTGEIFILKLLMALFINTFLKHFNNRPRDKSDEIEEEQLNDIVRNQVMAAKTVHHDHHDHHHKEFFLKTFCKKLEHSEKFENFIMCIIVVNIIVMAVDSPLLDHHNATKVVIHYLEMVFTGIYGCEILIKMIACGLIVKGGYFREPKNLIDFSLFCLNIAGFIFSSKLGILNALRAFHIVVLSKHFESLRIILIALYKSLPYLFKLLFFAFCFMLVFAVIPLRSLKGKMFKCVSLENEQLQLIITQIDCFDLGGDWIRDDFHYDNILYSLFNLFVIASCEGWSHFSSTAQDAVGVNIQPQQGHDRQWSIFFIIHFFIGNIMVFNAFTGVMTQKFNEINAKFVANQKVIPIKDKKFLNELTSFKYTEKISNEEQEWLSIKRSIYHTQPIRTVQFITNIIKFVEPHEERDKIRFFIYKFISSKSFELFIDGCTIASAIIFSITYHRAPEEYTDILSNHILILIIQNLLFVLLIIFANIYLIKFKSYLNEFYQKDLINDCLVLVYTIEIILKIIVEKLQFFSSRQNIFLILLLATSIIPTVYRLNNDSHSVSVIFRLLEIFRVLRLINTIPLIQSIISMMKFILPQIAPLAAVYLFTIYIYALFGMQLFAFIKPQSTLNGYDLHFKNFSSSMFTLVRISTGEQWFYIVPDIVRQQQPNFVCNDVYDHDAYVIYGLTGCGTEWGYLYFFTFHLIVSVIIFNLFIAVLLGLIKSQNTAVSKYQLAQIKDLWITYDRRGYGFIDYKNFWQFTSRIAMIYGVKKDDLLDPNQKKNFLKFLSLPIYIHNRPDCSIFGFRFHDVVVRMTQISLFLKYGILPGGKDESQATLSQFYKELDNQTKFVGELSQLKSGDIAVIILIQRRIKVWMKKGREMNQLKIEKPHEYNEVIKSPSYQQSTTQIKRNSIAGAGLFIAQQVELQHSQQKLDENILNDPKSESHKRIKSQMNVVSNNNINEMDNSENYDKNNIDENQQFKTTVRVFETAEFSHPIIQPKSPI